MRELTINKNDSGQRLDKFISKKFKTMPMPLMYRYIRQKKIKVNGKRAEVNTMLSEGDVIRLFIPEEFFDEKAAEYFLVESNVSVSSPITGYDANIYVAIIFAAFSLVCLLLCVVFSKKGGHSKG